MLPSLLATLTSATPSAEFHVKLKFSFPVFSSSATRSSPLLCVAIAGLTLRSRNVMFFLLASVSAPRVLSHRHWCHSCVAPPNIPSTFALLPLSPSTVCIPFIWLYHSIPSLVLFGVWRCWELFFSDVVDFQVAFYITKSLLGLSNYLICCFDWLPCSIPLTFGIPSPRLRRCWIRGYRCTKHRPPIPLFWAPISHPTKEHTTMLWLACIINAGKMFLSYTVVWQM